MTDFLVHANRLHQPDCLALDDVDARPATPTDREHADRCRRCTDGGSTRRQRTERGDIRNGAFYCPRHARGRMDAVEWDRRWG